MTQEDAFTAAGDALLKGLVYEPHFLSAAEEAALIEQVRKLPLKEAEYKQFQAKRRIHSYGGRYDFGANRLLEAEPIAPFLYPLRERVARWSARSAEDFAQAVVAEYTPGTQLGWHRDVPHFELVVGVSLGSPCKMRFRRYPPKARERSVAMELAPRSIYRLEGEARWRWQHRIAPTPALRYSILSNAQRSAAPGLSQKAWPSSPSVREFPQYRAAVERDVIGLIAVDLILRVVRAGVVRIALVVDVSSMHADDVAGNATRFRVPAHSIAHFELRAHEFRSP